MDQRQPRDGPKAHQQPPQNAPAVGIDLDKILPRRFGFDQIKQVIPQRPQHCCQIGVSSMSDNGNSRPWPASSRGADQPRCRVVSRRGNARITCIRRAAPGAPYSGAGIPPYDPRARPRAPRVRPPECGHSSSRLADSVWQAKPTRSKLSSAHVSSGKAPAVARPR
jgi:hypothetical protein